MSDVPAHKGKQSIAHGNYWEHVAHFTLTRNPRAIRETQTSQSRTSPVIPADVEFWQNPGDEEHVRVFDHARANTRIACRDANTDASTCAPRRTRGIMMLSRSSTANMN